MAASWVDHNGEKLTEGKVRVFVEFGRGLGAWESQRDFTVFLRSLT